MVVNPDEKQRSYFTAFLLINYGIEITNPEYVTSEILSAVDDVFHLHVPDSFYESPQDTKYFSTDELLLEQLISYFIGYGTPIKRIELFKKVLPSKFVVGDEMVLRTYTIIGKEKADEVLKETMKNMCSYKRPFSVIEKRDFLFLYDEGYFSDDLEISCKDNIFLLLSRNISLAGRLDKKDLVKYSISLFNEIEYGLDEAFEKRKATPEVQSLILAIDAVKDCPLSKKQAKFYNKIVKLIKGTKGKETNAKSPYSHLNLFIKRGDVVGAARYLSKQGSLLERNIKFFISRTDDYDQIREILNMINDKNPTLLFQLYTTIMDDNEGYSRIFRFARQNVVKTHIETDREVEVRQSSISFDKKLIISDMILDKIKSYYYSLPRLGNIYVSDEFENVAIPINTSACGKGLGVLPSGSRIKFDGRYLRVFCHWEGVIDIDASLVILKDDEMSGPIKVLKKNFLSWRTYASKPFGNAALCSGDDTSTNGAEYQDIDVDTLAEKGYRYAFACINGYGGLFNTGTIIQGVQIKNNIDTQPWDPKNISFQMNIVGDCRSFTGFAVDLKRKEIVIINTLSNCDAIVDAEQINVSRRFVLDYYLNFNVKSLLYCLGYIVNNPDKANYVFDKDYVAINDNQKIIRPYDVSALVSLVNMKRE